MSNVLSIESGESREAVAFALLKILIIAETELNESKQWTTDEILALYKKCWDKTHGA